ncbi:MAG: glutamate/tyrosine decarboxylase-like PLP-dependent enzyme [Chitinophagales bacterium]|jgi:glutamate/tyrosine decarboxylase-like PLP-dependent enzyme
MILNELTTSITESVELNDFFDALCEANYENYEGLIKEHNINFETLLPFASWSSESYQRICLANNDDCELILLCWDEGQKTPIHSHDGQKCWVYFAKGEFEEYLYAKGDKNRLLHKNRVEEGQVTFLTDEIGFHSLENKSSGLGMTLHLYANPIKNCQVYSESEEDFVDKEMAFDVDLSDSNLNAVMNQDLHTFVSLAQDLLNDEIENPVSPRIPSGELKKALNIGLSEEGIDEDQFVETLKKVVLATPKTSSNLFFNQLFGGRESKAVLGDLLAVMLNNSMYTFKVGGVQVGIEKEIIDQVIDRLDYGPNAGGTIPTGGSMSNFMAILMARDKYNEASRQTGLKINMIAYTSAESHYSIEKNAAFIGIGRENVRKIPANEFGEMNVTLLKEAIQKDMEAGHTPFFVNATAGTTVLGAFDSMKEINEVCKEHDVWMHVDGAYEGAVILSEKYKHMLDGTKEADSFSFNPHKMLGTPLTCSIIVVKDKKHLLDSFSNSAVYLYQTEEDDYNLGKTSFQCGRRNDALKLWTLWKSKGRLGLEKIVDKQFELSDYARDYVGNHPDYELYSFDNSIAICFNYKGIPPVQLCTDLYESDELMVGYGKFRGNEFVRMVTINSSNSIEDIKNFFNIIEDYYA